MIRQITLLFMTIFAFNIGYALDGNQDGVEVDSFKVGAIQQEIKKGDKIVLLEQRTDYQGIIYRTGHAYVGTIENIELIEEEDKAEEYGPQSAYATVTFSKGNIIFENPIRLFLGGIKKDFMQALYLFQDADCVRSSIDAGENTVYNYCVGQEVLVPDSHEYKLLVPSNGPPIKKYPTRIAGIGRLLDVAEIVLFRGGTDGHYFFVSTEDATPIVTTKK